MDVSLMGLWLAYGVATYESQAFFAEDEGWVWGNYSTYFHSIPEANCLPPPMNVRVPYPHSANHVTLMPETDFEAFGHAFVDEFEAASPQGVFRQERIFTFLRRGYEDLFMLNSEGEKLVDGSVTEGWAIAGAQFGAEKPPSSRDGIGERVYNEGVVIVHIRHGEAARPREY